jgi:hypothetical protein
MIPTHLDYEIVAAGTPIVIDITTGESEFYLWTAGAITLLGNLSVSPTGTPYVGGGDLIVIRYTGRINLGGKTFNVFGTNIDQELALLNLKIECRWDANAAAWEVIVMEDFSSVAIGVTGVQTTPITASGGSFDLTWGISANIQRFTSAGVITLGTGVTIQGVGTPAGARFLIIMDATLITSGGNNLIIQGNTLTALDALSGLIIASIEWTGAAWIAQIIRRAGVNDYRVMASSGDTTPDWLNGKTKESIEVDANKLHLVNDDAAPGLGYIYGTNVTTGVKGWFIATYFGAGLWQAGAGLGSIIPVLGTGNTATGDYATVLNGENNTASGNYSVAEGNGTTASGAGSHSSGTGTVASGLNSHAEGSGTTASGVDAHSEGVQTVASGDESHSEGVHTEAKGNSSHSSGNYSVAHLPASKSFASGRFNIKGDTEELCLFLKKITTDATPANLQNLIGNDGIVIPSDCTIDFDIRIVSVQTAGAAGTISDTVTQRILFGVQNLAGTLTFLTTGITTIANLLDVDISGNIISYKQSTIGALTTSYVPKISGTTVNILTTGEANKTVQTNCYVSMIINGYGAFSI